MNKYTRKSVIRETGCGLKYVNECEFRKAGVLKTPAFLLQCPVLVDALVQIPDSLVSVGCDGDKIVSSLRVKFGSRFSSVIGGISGHCTATGGD